LIFGRGVKTLGENPDPAGPLWSFRRRAISNRTRERTEERNEDGVLNGVSGHALRSVIDSARRSGISIELLSADLGLDLASFGTPSKRVPWEIFARILDRLAKELGGPDELRRFSEAGLAAGSIGILGSIGRVLASPRDVYSVGARWMGPSLFPMIRADMWDGADGILVQRLTLAPGHRDCPALFHIFHGALIALPRAWGHGPSEVSLELSAGSATYLIRTSSSRRGLLSRTIRGIRARFAFPAMVRELEDQQAAIDASYRELREAHARISIQATDLARVDSIGRELSKDVDLDRVLDGLVRILDEDLQVEGVELWLIDEIVDDAGQPDGPAPMRRVRQHGVTAGFQLRRHGLYSAGRLLGELVVYRPRGPEPGDATQILDLLIPWIALALDNALTYDRLQRHAEALEERVQERTARLLAVNHDLVREIDERKRATDALLQSEAQLRASERLASIGTLASGIAHEINNPVGAILAAAQLAQIVRKDPTAAAQIDSALVDIVAEAKRCGDIVRGVLQFARAEPTDKWECALRDLVVRSIRLTSAFAERHGTRIVAQLPDESPWVRANPTQIEQAIVNLIRNAIESGAREVAVGLRFQPGEGLAGVEVQDDGIGISDSDRHRILEPFFTTRRATGGTGLGLSVVHGIAHEHGGSLAVQPRSKPGTSIVLSIPTVPAPRPVGPARDDASDPSTSFGD